VTVVSDNDADVFERLSGIRPTVASNGVSDEAFALPKDTSSTVEVVFIAHLGWRPNIDAAQWMAMSVWPYVREALPDAVLRLIGRSPSPEVRRLAAADIVVDGDVDSVLPFLARARIATAPLLAAGGTRLKIIEALATGTPVVATGLGALGLEHLVDETYFVIADDPAVFAAEVVRLSTGSAAPVTIRASVRSYGWTEALEPLVAEVRRVSAEAGMPSPSDAPRRGE
jgi:glycosyltransferase involved in cell wall biosynthesis